MTVNPVTYSSAQISKEQIVLIPDYNSDSRLEVLWKKLKFMPSYGQINLSSYMVYLEETQGSQQLNNL